MNEVALITHLFTGLPVSADKFLMGVSTVAVIQIAGQTIVFDTGPYAYRPILQGRLRRAGIDPGSVSLVVISHAHWDMFANADLFPNADVVLHAKELAYAEATHHHDSDTPAYVAPVLKRLRLRIVDSEQELAPGAKLVELPGHTPGSIGLLVGDELLAGDAVHCASDAAAHAVHGSAFDPHLAKANLAKALSLATIIHPGHDRPFRHEPRVEYVSDYTLRLRFFTDPSGQDEELRIGSFAAKSFASWPND